MKKNPDDRPVILITGTSRGIGKFLAEYYLNEGYIVIGCSRSTSSVLHTCYHHFSIDISTENEIQTIFQFIRKQIKRLDIVINNAAINPAILSAALLPYNIMQSAFCVNVFAPMVICREAVKIMGRKKFGRIINIGSMATKHEVPGEALYTSTKAALNGYTRVLAKEVYKMGITVNVVSPAAIKTGLSAQINQQALTEVLSRNAINKFGEFEDVSNTIDFLIRKENDSITGQLIYLGGA